MSLVEEYHCNHASNSEPRRRQAKATTPLSSQAVFTLHRYSQHVPLLPYVNKSRPDCLQRPTSASALTEGPYVAAPTTSPKGRRFILPAQLLPSHSRCSVVAINPTSSHPHISQKRKSRDTTRDVHQSSRTPAPSVVGKPPLVSLCVTVPAASQPASQPASVRACSSTRPA